ncbi:DinB family protein [Promethearchaeum syntrophicum]|uniref:DinB family protein n=1 Tax=Promethearchaeum syntrophicum TaxID=2594042 RepID=A0A5B9DH85_9ARCH|nr:DinB family protein [Candidatus Prometheoarchaeum syntrophicum]QEE18037.1 DinB superfamily protein [Candidatus Prometheoarchaeum syntrophicum]
METTKSVLSSLVSLLRTYGHRLLAELTDEEIHWVPSQTRGRSIYSYFLHLINSEYYWFKDFGFSTPEYLGKDAPFDELLQSYNDLENYLIETIHNIPDDQFFLPTKFLEISIFRKNYNIYFLFYEIVT